MVRRKSFVHQQKLMVAGFVVTILALIAYLTLETVTDEGAQGDFIAGVHYVELDKPRRIRGDAIEVMEFFSYGCIFCYRFDEDLQDWARGKGDQIQLTQTPLIGSDQWRLLGAHFYALQDLDAPAELHQGTFRAIHDLGRKLNNPEDLNLKDIIEFSNNFSSLIKSQKCVVGRDTRPSGKMIQETISAVLMKNGIDVFDLGMVPTPVVFRESRKYGAGIVISSSHNPIEWNGMKFILDGRGVNEKELPQIINHQEVFKSKIGKIKKIK